MRQYTLLSQQDPRWKNIILGISNVTIGDDGCYIASYCVCANYFGHQITPDQMNAEFIQKKLYVQGDYIGGDDSLSKIFPDVMYQERLLYPDPTPADLGKLQQLMNDESLFVIAQIELPNKTSHFTPVTSCDGKTVTIMNVWDGQIEDITKSYGNPATVLVKYVVYKGTPRMTVAVDAPTFEKLVHKATVYDNVAYYLGFKQALVDPGHVEYVDMKLVIDSYINKPPQIIHDTIPTPVEVKQDTTVSNDIQTVPQKVDLPVTETISSTVSQAPQSTVAVNVLPTQANQTKQNIFLIPPKVLSLLSQCISILTGQR